MKNGLCVRTLVLSWIFKAKFLGKEGKLDKVKQVYGHKITLERLERCFVGRCLRYRIDHHCCLGL